MACYILTISVPKESAWIIEELGQLDGSKSAHVVQAIKDYLDAIGDGPTAGEKPPYWFVEGKDYSSTLSVEERVKLVKFGYKDEEVG